MDNSHALDEDISQLLDWMEAAQQGAPPMQVLVGAMVQALERKNRLIAALAEALMTSSCDCAGCVRMRSIVTNELEVEVVQVSVDPGTLEKCLTTEQ